MRYSLRDRFRGAVAGAILGEVLGYQAQTRLQAKKPFLWSEVDRWGFGAIASHPSLTGWGRIAVDGMQQLIHTHRWTIKPLPAKALDMSLSLSDSAKVMLNAKSGASAGLAIAALPLALYFHDDFDQLTEQIRQAIAVWHSGAPDTYAEAVQSALIPAYAIALALQEKLDPNTLIADLIDELASAESHASAVDLLNQVQHLLHKQSSLAAASQALRHSHSASSRTRIHPSMSDAANAVYGFLNTPEDFRLTLLQTAQLSDRPQIACALAGALSGAFNSTAGLPLGWRRLPYQHQPERSPTALLWNIASEANLLHLADQLLASWLGAYAPEAFSLSNFAAAVAAPDVIRSR